MSILAFIDFWNFSGFFENKKKIFSSVNSDLKIRSVSGTRAIKMVHGYCKTTEQTVHQLFGMEEEEEELPTGNVPLNDS